MYVIYTEQKNGKIARHFLSNTLTRTQQLVKQMTEKYPDRQAGYKAVRSN